LVLGPREYRYCRILELSYLLCGFRSRKAQRGPQKKIEISCFEELNVLAGELEARTFCLFIK
jgi:hypothetical protein